MLDSLRWVPDFFINVILAFMGGFTCLQKLHSTDH
jgi:hypothetical protein